MNGPLCNTYEENVEYYYIIPLLVSLLGSDFKLMNAREFAAMFAFRVPTVQLLS